MTFISSLHKFLKRHQIRYYDPDNQYLRHAIHSALAVAIALLATYYWHWQESAWLVLSSVFIMQTYLGDTKLQRTSLMAVSGLLTGIGAGLGMLVHTHWWAVLLLLGGSSFLMVMVGFWGQRYAMAGFFVNLLTLVSTGLPAAVPNQRIELILLGTLNCILVSFIPLTRTRYKISAVRENFWRCCYSYCRIQTRVPLRPLSVRVYRMHLLMSLTKIHPFLTQEQKSDYSRVVELLLDVMILKDKLPQHFAELLNSVQAINQALLLLLTPSAKPNNTMIMQQLIQLSETMAHLEGLSLTEHTFINAWQTQMGNLVQYVVELKTV